MPAIQPARLRHQVVELSQAYRQPEIFIRRLHDMLGLYTDRTHKPGRSGEPKPLMQAYNVPTPVMRQIMAEIKTVAQANLADTLVLCDLLWKQPYLECRSLAASILGYYEAQDYSPVIERMNAWLSEEGKGQVTDLILENATRQLRTNGASVLLEWIKDYLSSEQKFAANIGLRMLAILAREGDLENLPTIFKLINPMLRKVPQVLKQDLTRLVSELARRSPGETAYVLRKNLDSEDSPDAAWIIRQALNSFPATYQESLRAAMRSQGMQ